jgi:hypothetical protein
MVPERAFVEAARGRHEITVKLRRSDMMRRMDANST